jgi:hypothetical protein
VGVGSLAFGTVWVWFWVVSVAHPIDTGDVIASVVILTAGLTLIVRTFRQVLRVDAEGVLVRNPLRTWSLRWEEIEGFTSGLPRVRLIGKTTRLASFFGRQIHVVLTDGSIVPAEATARFWRFTGGRAQVDRMLEELRAYPTSRDQTN